MPALTLVNDFSAGAALSSSFWNDNLYNPVATNGSFEIINGHLDADNMDATWPEVLPEQVQRKTYGDMGFVAGTANLDYFNEWFREISTNGVTTSTYPTRPLPVPGANATFHVPSSAMAVLSWTVFWTNISDNPTNQTRMHLYIDDVLQATQRRDVRRTSEPSGTFVYGRNHDGRVKNRYWTGHHSVELAPGYHTAGLRILQAEGVEQSRVWARSFRYILFKKAATWG